MTSQRRLWSVQDAYVLALGAVLGFLTLTWIPLTSLGGFDLTLPYAMALVLGLLLLLSFGRASVALREMLADAGPWLVAYLGYLLVLSIRLAGTANNGIMIRQSFFLLCGMVVACSIVLLRANPKPLRRGGAFAIIGFLVVTEYYARQIGLSWSVALQRFFGSGDLGFVVYEFLREIFRTAQFGDVEVVASVKNTVAVGLFTALIFFRAGHSHTPVDWKGRILTGVVLVVLFLLNTRSVLVIAAVALPMALTIASIRNPQHSARKMVASCVVVMFAAALAVVILSWDTAAISIFENRFAFDDHSSSGRVLQIQQALAGIEQNILTGSGLTEFNGQLVHNLFLGAWLHGGLGAFLLVVTFYLGLLGGWLSFLFQISAHRDAWVLPMRAEWVAVMPLLPLFRVWVAGDAGHPDFASWIAIFAFVAVVHANRKERSGFRGSDVRTNAVAV